MLDTYRPVHLVEHEDTNQDADLPPAKALDAAFSEIHRHGFQAASLTQILTDTGLTKGALYHHFPDKKALGLAVIQEVIRPRLAAMMFEPLATTLHPLADLRAMFAAKSAIRTLGRGAGLPAQPNARK